MSRTRNQRKRAKMLEQRVIGILLLAITVLILCLCYRAGEDCGAAFLTGGLGAWLLFASRSAF